MKLRYLLIVPTVILAYGCSQAELSTLDARVSPFSPDFVVEATKVEKPSAASLALSPSFGGAITSDDPFDRAVTCAASIKALGTLLEQLSERPDERTRLALGQAYSYYADQARKAAPKGAGGTVEARLDKALQSANVGGKALARNSAACLRNDPPPTL
ncbi:MAG TPA: hypothetical protein VFS91_10310 [Nitrobacter sp.]|nr:hypothetical protein [Nitrobacter sp.]